MKSEERVHRLIFLVVAGVFAVSTVKAQDVPPKKLTLDGYVSGMQSVMDMESTDGYWLYETQLHNRLNLNYYPSSTLSFSIQVRNRFITGDRLKMDAGGQAKRSLEGDPGFADLSFNLARGKSYVINTTVDRLWLKYTLEKLEVTLGRQRINWGQTLVWNPNDWFNNYSYFDFDYPEKPGSDALRIQYYTGALSAAEIVVTTDSTKKATAAIRYRMNSGTYDLQLLGGLLSDNDVAFGFGWAGGLRDIGFRGELAYFHPVRQFADTSGLFFMSLGLDYTFSNSLAVLVEGLYCRIPDSRGGINFLEFYQRPMSVKDLSFTEWNLFGQVSYPFTPLWNGSFAAMFFPDVRGIYLGPAITYSLTDNFDFSFYMQWFSVESPGIAAEDDRQNFTMAFLRFKYNF